jgi:hypothetical protein
MWFAASIRRAMQPCQLDPSAKCFSVNAHRFEMSTLQNFGAYPSGWLFIQIFVLNALSTGFSLLPAATRLMKTCVVSTSIW